MSRKTNLNKSVRRKRTSRKKFNKRVYKKRTYKKRTYKKRTYKKQVSRIRKKKYGGNKFTGFFKKYEKNTLNSGNINNKYHGYTGIINIESLFYHISKSGILLVSKNNKRTFFMKEY